MRATLSLETNLIRKGGRDHYHHARLLSGQHLLPLRRRLLVTKTEGDTLKDALETVSHSNMEKRVVANRLGVPLEPTWSIKAFLSESSPSSRINTSSNDSEGSNVGAFNGKDASLLLDDQTLDKLHRLAALQVPGRGSEQREALSRELAELVKLVNAVREYDVSNPQEMENAGDVSSMIPDGRIYPLPARLDLSSHASYGETSEEGPMVVKGETDQGTRGRVLLKHSQTATDTMYILPRKKVE
ncbi:hypothetical protein FRC19_003792 [Serendipita sp. 401]|nr:hypothetical protein FRC19_003792 [Serendipita sp. 401]